MDLLQTTLYLPTCPEQLQLLCVAVLREMSPSDSLSLSCDHVQNSRPLSLVASVLLAQVTSLSLPRYVALPWVALVLACGPPAGTDLSRGRLGSASPSVRQFLWPLWGCPATSARIHLE